MVTISLKSILKITFPSFFKFNSLNVLFVFCFFVVPLYHRPIVSVQQGYIQRFNKEEVIIAPYFYTSSNSNTLALVAWQPGGVIQTYSSLPCFLFHFLLFMFKPNLSLLSLNFSSCPTYSSSKYFIFYSSASFFCFCFLYTSVN